MSKWFADAKLGIWSHWGPQSVARRGDWYARRLYLERRAPAPDEVGPTSQRLFHEARFGHPSEFGMKDVCAQWRAERWDPDALMDLYVDAGAQYFVALADHIDNFDLWDSAHQPWNAVNVGPRTDVVARWAAAAERRGLRFGISLHANWAWALLDVAFGADDDGPYAGVRYDGRTAAGEGAGRWWDGLDPADLYGPPRVGTEPPAAEFVERFYRRLWDAFRRFRPDLVYLDDARLPFGVGSAHPADPPRDTGSAMLERMLTRSATWEGAGGRTIVTVKRVEESDAGRLTLDVERHVLADVRAEPWQMDTCLGHWFYQDGLAYKSAGQLIRMLVDVVSKNGTMLLSVPQLPDGTIDEEEVAILTELGAWLRINGEAIYRTRPWKIHGEGPTRPMVLSPARDGAPDRYAEADIAYTGGDIRFTSAEGVIYAIVLGGPDAGVIRIRSLGAGSDLIRRAPARVDLLGGDAALSFDHHHDALVVALPPGVDLRHPVALRVTGVEE